jgi:hypothetical protein
MRIIVRDGYPMSADGRCTATARSGERCKAMAVTDMNVCRLHGAGSPKAIEGAQRRKAEREATALLAKFAVPVEGSNPIRVLQDRLDVQVGVVAWLEDQLRATPAHLSGMVALVEDFTAGMSPPGRAAVEVAGNGPALLLREDTYTESEHGTKHEITLKINPLMQLYAKERQILTDLCFGMVKIGFEQKLVDARVAEVRMVVAPVVQMLRVIADDPRLSSVAPVLREVIAEALSERRELVA